MIECNTCIDQEYIDLIIEMYFEKIPYFSIRRMFNMIIGILLILEGGILTTEFTIIKRYLLALVWFFIFILGAFYLIKGIKLKSNLRKSLAKKHNDKNNYYRFSEDKIYTSSNEVSITYSWDSVESFFIYRNGLFFLVTGVPGFNPVLNEGFSNGNLDELKELFKKKSIKILGKDEIIKIPLLESKTTKIKIYTVILVAFYIILLIFMILYFTYLITYRFR